MSRSYVPPAFPIGTTVKVKPSVELGPFIPAGVTHGSVGVVIEHHLQNPDDGGSGHEFDTMVAFGESKVWFTSRFELEAVEGDNVDV